MDSAIRCISSFFFMASPSPSAAAISSVASFTAIGFPFPEDPEYHCREIRHGHRILLCSDGLWSMVEDKQIHEILMSAETPQKASDTLVLKANEAGGTDNITAVVIFC